jgi:hypothetical protein
MRRHLMEYKVPPEFTRVWIAQHRGRSNFGVYVAQIGASHQDDSWDTSRRRRVLVCVMTFRGLSVLVRTDDGWRVPEMTPPPSQWRQLWPLAETIQWPPPRQVSDADTFDAAARYPWLRHPDAATFSRDPAVHPQLSSTDLDVVRWTRRLSLPISRLWGTDRGGPAARQSNLRVARQLSGDAQRRTPARATPICLLASYGFEMGHDAEVNMSDRKTIKGTRPRGEPRSLLVTGIGYFALPAAVEDVERWRVGVAAANAGQAATAGALADMMVEAIRSGIGVVADADIAKMVVVHFKDGDSVSHVRDLAADRGISEDEVWAGLADAERAGLLLPCAASGCGDKGWSAAGSREELFQTLTVGSGRN